MKGDRMNFYIGIDLGGTNVKGAVVCENGEIIREAVRPTRSELGPDHVSGEIAGLIQELSSEYAPERIGGVGLGCPGTVEDTSGIVLYSNNLGWENYDIRAALKARGIPNVRLINDANAAALGEATIGCAKDADTAVILTLGTGVGSGVILGKKVLTGYGGAASELGHMVIAAGGEPCTCGRRGCLEAYASATALIRMTREAIARHPESFLSTLAHDRGGVDGQTAFDAKAAGDHTADEVVQQYIHYLAIGVANIINCFYPQVIALSGGIANQGETLLKPLREAVKPRVFGGRYIRRPTEIIRCVLGYRAGIIGAAMLAKLSQDLPLREFK